MDDLALATYAGSALLVAVAALPMVSKLRVTVTSAWFAAWLLITVIAVRWAVPELSLVPDTEPSRIIQYATRELAKAIKDPPHNLIVIDGGSFPARGLDPKAFRKELKRLGYEAKVVQLALGAANHFERHKMYADLLSNPELKALARQPNLVFLAENHYSYDHTVLMQFQENTDTSRAYHYMTPSNGFLALRAIRTGGGIAGSLKTPEWTVLRHVLINAFNVGLMSRVAPVQSIKPRSGYVKGGVDAKYRFKGLAPAMQAATAPLPEQFELSWLFDIREPRLKAVWGPYVDHWVYFSVPGVRPPHILSIRQFCTQTDSPCIVADDLALLRELDDKKYWRDDGHLTTQGGPIYSKWLANQLVETGTLQK